MIFGEPYNKDHSGNLDVDGKIILSEQGVRVCPVFIWLGIESIGGPL
jgi:hypothetical protein